MVDGDGEVGGGQRAQLDALSREASEAVNMTAERLRTALDEFRALETGGASAEELSTARATIDPIEVALRALQDLAHFLDRTDDEAGRAAEAVAQYNGQADRRRADPARAFAVLAAREQERARLAEEMHDGPAQMLANAIFQMDSVDRAVRHDPATATAEVASLRQRLQHELETLRAYISQLRPPLAEPEGLDEALRESAESLTEFTSIPVDLRLDAPTSLLGEAARSVALRVAQEALRNVGKHSGARRAWLVTRVEPRPTGDAWVLEVGDDGRGFEIESAVAQKNRRHFGLRFMRERSDLLGSRLVIDTAPGAGTVVRLTIATGGERS